MIGFQLAAIFLQPFFGVGNDVLDIMVAIHRPTMWVVFVGIRVPELLDIGSEVEIWWTIKLFRFLVLLKSVYTADGFHDSLGLPISYQKVANTNQNIFPVSLPCG